MPIDVDRSQVLKTECRLNENLRFRILAFPDAAMVNGSFYWSNPYFIGVHINASHRRQTIWKTAGWNLQ